MSGSIMQWRRLKPSAWICAIACAVALSACGRSGPVLRPDPPQVELAPLPADKMQAPTFGKQARQTLLQPQTTPTAGSSGSKQN